MLETFESTCDDPRQYEMFTFLSNTEKSPYCSFFCKSVVLCWCSGRWSLACIIYISIFCSTLCLGMTYPYLFFTFLFAQLCVCVGGWVGGVSFFSSACILVSYFVRTPSFMKSQLAWALLHGLLLVHPILWAERSIPYLFLPQLQCKVIGRSVVYLWSTAGNLGGQITVHTRFTLKPSSSQ